MFAFFNFFEHDLEIKKGDVLYTIHSESEGELNLAYNYAITENTISIK